MSNLYLQHHGIKGQKWGVRRYQNADGSLTEAGKKRYGYGDINVDRNGGVDGKVRISDSKKRYIMDNEELTVDIPDDMLEDLEYESTNLYLNAIAAKNNVPLNKVEKYVDKHPELVKNANDIIDQYMEMKLKDILAKYADKVLDEPQKIEKPKYTQKQAIDKVYSDLEKKYPDFNSFDQDKQDKLFMKYANSSGLYKYM